MILVGKGAASLSMQQMNILTCTFHPICPNDKTILQPTRIIKRKGIERAIELVKILNGSQYKLLISHEGGDEGFEYATWIKNFAYQNGVDLRFPRKRISSPWDRHINNSNGFSLWDVYAHADFVTFPSINEGFGNAFLEAIYYKKPILVNRYATFIKDIEPKGFDLITIDGHLTSQVVYHVREILESPKRKKRMVNHNYKIAKQHYSYKVLQQQLNAIINKIFKHRGYLNRSIWDDGEHSNSHIKNCWL